MYWGTKRLRFHSRDLPAAALPFLKGISLFLAYLLERLNEAILPVKSRTRILSEQNSFYENDLQEIVI